MLEVGDLVVDFFRSRVWVGGKEIQLSRREYSILYCLARNVGITIPHHVLLDAIWGEEDRDNFHLLYSNINRVNKKLGRKFIANHRNFGYCLPGQLQEVAWNCVVVNPVL